MLISNILTTDVQERLIEVYLQSIYLLQLLSYMVCITNFDLDDLNLMKKMGKKYLNYAASVTIEFHEVYGPFVRQHPFMQKSVF